MDSAAPIGGTRRGLSRWRRAIPALLGLPVLMFLLGNLVLSSAWSCRWIATKIQLRTGLEARVGGASWSPWNGASISGLELLQPAPLRALIKEPLVEIDRVRVTPVWPAWLRGRIEIRSIELETPRFVLPVELMSHLAAPPQPPSTPTAPPVVPTAPPPAVIQPAAPPPPVASVEPQKLPPRPALPPQPTGWLRLKNASFAIVHAGSIHPLLEISKTSGAIPISGDSAQSILKIGGVSAFGKEAISNLATTLDWTFPLLSLKPVETEIDGYQFLIAAKIGALSGLPVQLEAQLPRQALAAFAVPFDGQAAAESIAANLRFRGLLLAPGTWQGDLVADASAPNIRVAGHETKFDKASAVIVLRGGLLSCVDARLISDDVSVLGNASLLADGRAAGAARLVATPESVSTIVSRIFTNLTSPPSLTPLATPQRAAFDLEAFGAIGRLFLRLGKDGPIVNLNP
ncbi:MAG: hypothetical protein V4819_17410 [Verrucomicrobiota bacterium]